MVLHWYWSRMLVAWRLEDQQQMGVTAVSSCCCAALAAAAGAARLLGASPGLAKRPPMCAVCAGWAQGREKALEAIKENEDLRK